MRKYMLASAVMFSAMCALYAQSTPAAQSGAPAIKVEKIVTAAGVEEREPVNEAVSFDKATSRVFTWTRISADRTPVRIKHVYYADGKKTAEIELSVNSSPYRLWSYKTVWPGNWKVDVTDEAGTVLASVEFTVSAAGTGAENPAAAGK